MLGSFLLAAPPPCTCLDRRTRSVAIQYRILDCQRAVNQRAPEKCRANGVWIFHTTLSAIPNRPSKADSTVNLRGECARRKLRQPTVKLQSRFLLSHRIVGDFHHGHQSTPIDAQSEAETHWLRYRRLVSRTLCQWQLRNPGSTSLGSRRKQTSDIRMSALEQTLQPSPDQILG